MYCTVLYLGRHSSVMPSRELLQYGLLTTGQLTVLFAATTTDGYRMLAACSDARLLVL